jgi:hypothetical protein
VGQLAFAHNVLCCHLFLLRVHGKDKAVPCPSAVWLSVVPTKPYYTIVPVFVKGRCLLLEMLPAWQVGVVMLGGIFSAFGGSHRFHSP